MSGASLATLARLQRQARRGFAHGSEIRDGEAFRIHLRPAADAFYRNLALPLRRPGAWPAAIGEMLDIFSAAGRQPRLELLEELWPDLPGALESAGLVCETRAAVLVSEAPWPGAGDPLDSATILGPETPSARLEAYAERVVRVFDMPAAVDPGNEAGALAREIVDGRTLAAVRLDNDEPIAGACLIGLGAEAELAGVWTLPDRRRRGHALAVCGALMARFFAGGGELLWLSAGEQAGERLYRRLGFTAVGTQLNYALPAPPGAASGASPAARA